MTPDSALSLLRHSARISPPLLAAVVLVEDEILRLREVLTACRENEQLQESDSDLCERIDQALYFDGEQR